nr:MFS transporter [Roseibium denhamense]
MATVKETGAGQAGDAVITPAKGRLRVSALMIYGVMALPLAFAGLPIYLNAPDFYAVVFDQPLTSLGAVLLALRLVDAFQDPLIGSLSDRFHAHRSAILMLGAVFLGSGFWMLFHPPATYPLAWFALSVFICTTGYSIVAINYQTVGGLWNCMETDRTRVTGFREAFGLVGLLIAAIAPAVLAEITSRETAFHWLTIAYLPLLAGALVILLSWLRTAPLQKPSNPDEIIGWTQLLKDRWRAIFFGTVFLNSFASAIPAVLVLFFVRDRIGAEAYTGLFLLIYFLSGVVSMPVWMRIAARSGKLAAWRYSLMLSVITFLGAAFLGLGDLAGYALVCALSGLALGADLALPPAILADHLEADGREADASRLFAFMALLSKAALAVATGLALPMLGLVGYHPNVDMTPSLNLALSFTYAVLPCVMKIGVFCILLASAKTLAQGKSAV